MKATKSKVQYFCQNCGTSSPKWLGRCTGCGEWNTLVEERVENLPKSNATGSMNALRDDFREMGAESGGSSGPVTLSEITVNQAESVKQETRLTTGVSELDRVLGGGLVRDSFVLLGGEPGIGKSTLLLHVAQGLAKQKSKQPVKVLYVTGEESPHQVLARARRLGVTSDDIVVVAETQLEKVLADVKEIRPQVVFIDSIQTISTAYLESAPGSVSQVREVSARLMTLAKTAGISVWLVGHVTKDGSIAGPKVVEHMVDTVLYFESDPGQNFRLLRTMKNRFGGTRELGVFEMGGQGLREVVNPSELFLTFRKERVSGTAISATMEGSRTLLAEIRALVTPSPLAMPRRTSVGLDSNRLSLLAAIIERHMRLPLSQRDLFFNVAGGLSLSEPASDLACVAALVSSADDISLASDWVWIGEVALTGEVRRVSQIDSRLEEARKLGFKCAIIPPQQKYENSGKLKVFEISKISEIPELIMKLDKLD